MPGSLDNPSSIGSYDKAPENWNDGHLRQLQAPFLARENGRNGRPIESRTINSWNRRRLVRRRISQLWLRIPRPGYKDEAIERSTDNNSETMDRRQGVLRWELLHNSKCRKLPETYAKTAAQDLSWRC